MSQAGVELAVPDDEPPALSRWRLASALAEQASRERSSTAILNLSPYEKEQLGPIRTGTTILLSLITGVGLMLLHHQSRSELRSHGLTPAVFFRSDGMGRGRSKGRRRIA